MKEIIVNCTNDKKTIIVTENTSLLEKYEESDELERLEGNIYLGIVTDILPGMQAAFVNIGKSKNAFLHIKDILPKVSNETGNKNEDLSKYNIKDYVKVGMPLIVEVKKDKTDKKGAKVSTNLNIPSKFVVLIPNMQFVTISQKIEDKDQIERLGKVVSNIKVNNYGIIIRTSAVNASNEEIENDIKRVIEEYENMKSRADEYIKQNKNISPVCLLEKGSIVDRLLLDIGSQNLGRIIVNNKDIYEKVERIIKENNLDVDVKIIDKENILDLYEIDKQIDKITKRKVWLDCGGFIMIDQTEALTAIDVNSGKFIGKESIEKTVLKVNMEATEEIAKQIRARNIGGIIIVDYIDMDTKKDEEIVLELLEKNLKKDRAKTQVVDFTKLHLLEMTRKKLY